jgi:16S rRNA (guanine527-N7)-methyltransferase
MKSKLGNEQKDNSLELLREGVEILGLSLSDTQYERFTAYLGEIALFNRVYKLVAAEGEEVVVKHVLDSLAAVPVFTELMASHNWTEVRLCDIGSGAGFPGIPLAIMLENVRVTLVERSGRRCGFLRNAVAMCNLASRVEVLEKDLSEVTGTFEIVTFRAFHPLVDIIHDIERIVGRYSVVCAYKGRMDAIDVELSDLARLYEQSTGNVRKVWNTSVAQLQVPFLDAPRHMLMLERND